ncbi:MAG: winged helix-turn-helix transcriptional regulator [Anaerolineales bacterium]|nr:winged helix-turn-helix transcriptional regulator [Anaerolineales bacterium]MCB9109640.1 winged helix-turn-helix transcriptional regulator [Anaerolineales bacterium]
MKKQPIHDISKKLAAPLNIIASPQRIAILLAIGKGEACVCHLETALGWRQAYISQHLMALRKADILRDRREGRYVYYSLKDASLLDLITASASLSGLAAESVSSLINTQTYPSCACPHCTPAIIPASSL